ncbi:GvpL/GvpF family gas vesicle protein [Actinomadura opuntiae]|uniref:GvpL/GvpF family gas vesicle protein n=1 Tax=Actinomadura sp. OS1-43 TaxID=604315 RepID=UPI00255AD4B0|nr:GvpL/GvpF family gas vesicle protein [Actinomadura sp. OS1-43]MDL4822145.1 GvpL/GvpF family gas vesicle protein [Actinomadura sp. OS1-43]
MTDHRTATGDPTTAEHVQDDELAVYLYGVARGLDPAALEGAVGVAGAPVRTVSAGSAGSAGSGGLTALVSTVRLAEYGEAALRENLEDLAWLEATARAHHEVVDRAAHAAPTAPVRIATIYRDDARVAQVLAEQGDRFAQALDRVAGRVEWGVKAYAHRDALEAAEPSEPAAPEPDAGAQGAGAGTAYLRRRQQERRRRTDAGRKVSEQATAIHDGLAALAVAARHHPPQDPKLSGHAGVQILNAAYLLDEDAAAAFADAARAAGERYPGIEVELTGPWPPYSFIDTTAPASETETETGSGAGSGAARDGVRR